MLAKAALTARDELDQWQRMKPESGSSLAL
jgi:hypothetical protein